MNNQLAAAAALWGMADYPRVADRLMPAARRIAAAVGETNGHAIDVGAGTGNVTTCLQEQGWTVHATDVSERMVELGSERTGPTVRWDVAAAEALPAPTGAADAVVSNFGLIFAVGVDQALHEVRRVLRPGGVLVFTAWPADGYMATMTDIMMRFLPAAPDSSPMDWGNPAVIASRLAGFGTVVVKTASLPWNFDSPAHARQFYERCSPAHAAVMSALARAEARAMMDAVEAQLTTLTQPDGRVRIDADYLLVTATVEPPAAVRWEHPGEH